AIRVRGQDAVVDGDSPEPPLRVRLYRSGGAESREVRGRGYQGKLYRHPWVSCAEACELSAAGGGLVAMVSGPADALLLMLDGSPTSVATGLGEPPSHKLL